ncbi:MAG: DUF423 domain-containing protein [Methylocystis sp.]|nr:DUF423 domain-containing protein [Methylocystis sp.]
MQKRPAFIVMIASLQGAAGVGLAAAAAHIENSANLHTASLFLMVHAGAGLALAALAAGQPGRSGWLLGATLALLFGVTLFSGDLASRAWRGDRLFPYAAPLGGAFVILAWLAVAAVALAWLLAPAGAGDPPERSAPKNR